MTKESMKRVPKQVLPISGSTAKHFLKSIHNVKVTILCGFVTILVLRGTIGAGSFGSSTHGFSDLQEPVQRRKDPTRQLTEVRQPKMEEADLNVRHPKMEEALKQEDPEAEADLNVRQPKMEEALKQEDPEAEADLNVTYSLGPKISDWNEQRSFWLSKNPGLPAMINGKPRILLVTGSQPMACDNPVGDHYHLKFIKNKIDYCRLHGIEIFYNMAHLDHEMAGYWAKLPLIRKLMLAHPEVEWIWWMDSDAMFTDMVFELPMEKYKDFNLILHGWDELVYHRKNWIGLNTGSFLLRNCQWSLDILDTWAPMGPKGRNRLEAGKILTKTLEGRPEFEADDQSALVYLLATRKDEWGDKVFLENSYYLHGYWVILVEKYEEMIEKHHPGLGDETWPFVTHFVGCKPCARYGAYPVERCLKHMERAFNFGDNQILQMFGFQHKNLGTFKVKRTRNDTALPLEI